MNEEAIRLVESGEHYIADKTIDAAYAWIDAQPFDVLQNVMRSDDWDFHWEEYYDDLSEDELRKLAKWFMYEDSSYVLETITNAMKIVIYTEAEY